MVCQVFRRKKEMITERYRSRKKMLEGRTEVKENLRPRNVSPVTTRTDAP